MATFSIDVSDIVAKDAEAARFIIARENERRAAQDPPETPLPDSTGAELKSSYLTMLTQILDRAHTDYIRQAGEKKQREQNVKQLWLDASDAQRQAAIEALKG